MRVWAWALLRRVGSAAAVRDALYLAFGVTLGNGPALVVLLAPAGPRGVEARATPGAAPRVPLPGREGLNYDPDQRRARPKLVGDLVFVPALGLLATSL